MYGDYRHREWAKANFWRQGAWRVLASGFPCQPVAPNGKQLGLDDPRAVEIWGFVAMTKTTQPDLAILENVYALYKSGILKAITEAMRPEYEPLVPEGAYMDYIRSKSITVQCSGIASQ